MFLHRAQNSWRNTQPCYRDEEPGDPPTILTVNCSGNYQFVTIYNDQFNIKVEKLGVIIGFCEVQVFGKYGACEGTLLLWFHSPMIIRIHSIHVFRSYTQFFLPTQLYFVLFKSLAFPRNGIFPAWVFCSNSYAFQSNDIAYPLSLASNTKQ